MTSAPIPRNTWSRTVRLLRIDDVVGAGLGFTADPNRYCTACGDRIGTHVLVVDGDKPADELVDDLMNKRIAGTVENYDRPDLPYACATFGFLPRLVP